MRKYLVLCVSILSIYSSSFAQRFEGRVLDANKLLPLENATVEIRSYGKITTTGPDGSFDIESPYYPTKLLVYKPGYRATTIELRKPPTAAIQVLLLPWSYELDSILVTAGETDQLLRNQAGSVTLLRGHELSRDNQLSLAPALNRVPGVQMQQGALNTARISIRGIGARTPFGTSKIRAYFEDIPLTDGTGSTSLEDQDLSFIGSMEVMRGPTSSIYGGGLGGTIRLNANLPQWNHSSVKIGGEIGSFGQQRWNAVASLADKTSSLNIAATNTHVDGFRDNSSYDRTGVSGVGRWLIGTKSSLTWIGQWTSVMAFIPSSIDSSTFADEPSSAAFTWAKTKGFESYDRAFTGLSWRYQYNRNLEHWISVFGGYRDAYEPRPFNILREGSIQQGVRARWMFRQQSWRLTAGLESFREAYDWQTYVNIDGLGDRGGILSDNEELRRYTNFFVQGRGEVTGHLSWEAGANLNTTNYLYEDYFNPDSSNLGGTYTFSPTFSPRAALLWSAPNWTARIQMSHGFSPPTLEETLTPDGQINPEIAPETGWNLEAGWRGFLVPRKLWLDATIYRMWISDLLVARRVGNDQFVGVNAGSTLHDGFELALNYRPVHRLVIWANYAGQQYRFTDFVDDQDDYSGNQVTGVPVHQATAGLEVALFDGIGLIFTSQYVSEIPLRDDNSVYSEDYFLTNLRLNFMKTYKGFSGTLYAGVNNLADVSYASQVLVNAGSFGGNQPRYYYPGNPRSWYLGLQIGLGK